VLPHRSSSGRSLLADHPKTVAKDPPQSGILLVLTVVFVPETAYNRKDISTLQVSVESGVMQRRLTSSTKNFEPTDDEMAPRISDEKKGQQELVKDDSSVQMVEEATPSAEQRESFVHSLRLWSGHRFSHEPFLTVAKRSFTISLSPAVLWGALVYGTTNAWRMFIPFHSN
jgi:hypothetical protein